MSNIRITIRGDKDCIDTLQYLNKEFQTPIEPLEHSSKVYLQEISSNFKNEGRTFGQPWPPLRPATIAEKRKLFKEGKSKAITKPLVRTGALRAGFENDMPNKNTSRIYNTQDYAKLHQEGGTVTVHGRKVRVPKRVLAAVDATRVKMVERVFVNWINKLIKVKKAG